MKEFWGRIIRAFKSEPAPNAILYEENKLHEHAMRLRRRMELGTWRFNWAHANKKRLAAIHKNLPELIELTRLTRLSVINNVPIPKDVLRSAYGNGVFYITLDRYMCDDEGLFLEPASLVRAFISEVLLLCKEVSRIRKDSPVIGESVAGKCTYLFAELRQVIDLLG